MMRNESSTKEEAREYHRNGTRQPLTILEACGNYDMYGEMNFNHPPNDCIFPQISMLDTIIHQDHPRAILILNMRHPSHWASSVRRWGSLATRLAMCGRDDTISSSTTTSTGIITPSSSSSSSSFPPPSWLGPESSSLMDLEDWYCDHVARVRQFVSKHPSHVLIEVDIESPSTGDRLVDLFVGSIPSRDKVNNRSVSMDNEDDKGKNATTSTESKGSPTSRAVVSLVSPRTRREKDNDGRVVSHFWQKDNANTNK